MSRGIQFGDDPHSSSLPILNDLSGFFGGIGLLGRVRGMFSDFRVGVQYQRKGVLVDDMPVQNIHLIVHHGIDGFIDELKRQKVP